MLYVYDVKGRVEIIHTIFLFFSKIFLHVHMHYFVIKKKSIVYKLRLRSTLHHH